MTFSMGYMALIPACDACCNILPGTILFSVSYSLYVPTLWASPSLTVNKNSIGLAYGCIGSVRNLGVSIIAVLTGVISDKYAGYSTVSGIVRLDREIFGTDLVCRHGNSFNDCCIRLATQQNPIQCRKQVKLNAISVEIKKR
eukprot:TRINITY_DN11196_c0_g2_i1.p1 TRINITY_DN11196_c0_g2~~TRINITY_DN11196_c0_g2_i1.p1  ORF type:complete len:142 (-),score=6.52 TRINITY_DN11196_c0_g2_i1:95-520(-)